ncbi:glycosyltransferase family 4 protein [Rubritalea tangerina]|uniref:Glycosyltransferase family 4 protein n=1 Tax=Rubritalea tangerina TaxID=430798 RepID=A0ABW4Z6F2_9BACT
MAFDKQHGFALHLSWESGVSIQGGLGVAVSQLTEALEDLCETRLLCPDQMPCKGIYEAPSSYESLEAFHIDAERLYSQLKQGERIIGGGPYFEAVMRYTQWVVSVCQSRPRVVHAHDWHTFIAAVWLKQKWGCPLVLHYHSTQYERVGQHVSDTVSGIERWGAQRADHVIAVSELSRQHLIETIGVEGERVSILHNTIPVVHREEEVSAERVLLYVGRLCSQKAPFMMLEIFRKVLVEFPDARLIMVGTGVEAGVLRQVVDFCQLSERVELLGKVPYPTMSEIYKRGGIFCMPSMAEPFGIAALEAASYGMPVVLSEVCGASEVLKSAKRVPVGDARVWADAVCSLLENDAELRATGLRCQKEAASHTWQDAATKLDALYREITCGRYL